MTRISLFARRGDRRDRLEDAILAGPLVVAGPTSGPLELVFTESEHLMIAVFDGMGGHPAGHRASQSAARELAQIVAELPAPDGLGDALVETGRRLVDEAASNPALTGMGTTVAGVRLTGSTATAFNVGDSRVYSLQASYLCQHSVDDTSKLDPRGGLSQCLGGGIRYITPHLALISVDRSALLLCTDGLYRHVPVSEIEAALAGPDAIAALWALAQGASDDVAVVVVDRRSAGISPTSVSGLVAVEMPPPPPPFRFGLPPLFPLTRRSPRPGKSAEPKETVVHGH